MTTLRADSGYSSASLVAPPPFRLVTVLALCMLSLVCVVLAVIMILYSNVHMDAANCTDRTWLVMLYKLPLQLVIPSIVGGCVHWVALQLYLHN
jgi:hypothetical protein